MPLPWRAMAKLVGDRLLRAGAGVLAIAGALAAVAGAAAGAAACLVVLYRLASQDPIERWALAGALLFLAALAWRIAAGVRARLQAFVRRARAVDAEARQAPGNVVPFPKRGRS